MRTADQDAKLVGYGAREGARLFREWFAELSSAAEHGEKTAYVFVSGSFAELLRTFDFHVSFPEINSLQTAVRHAEQEYLELAEDYGYSPDICAYVKVGVGIQLRQGEHPMGRIPKPSLAVLTNACNTYVKWAEIWERLYHIPAFTVDVPGSRSAERFLGAGDLGQADPHFESDRRYVEHQVRELIELCEHVSGKKFDIDKLREHLRNTNEMGAGYQRLLQFNQNRPAPFNAISDGAVYLGVANALRGEAEGAKYFSELAEEMAYKCANRIGTPTEEKYRLIFVGVPCYPIFRRFHELFAKPGGVFVFSSYSMANGGLDSGFRYDLSRPIESLAEGILVGARRSTNRWVFAHRFLPEMVRDYRADGVVYHPIKSCRLVSTGLADTRRVVDKATGVMSVFIESDLVDRRVVSEAQMKSRIDAFFEALARREFRTAAAAASPGGA